VLYSTEMFSEKYVLENGEKEEVDLWKRALCISVRQTNLSRATTLPWYGMGLSPKFVCFSADSLILYKGSWYIGSWCTYPGIQVVSRNVAIVNRDPSGFIWLEDTWVLPLWHWSYTRRTEVDCRGMPGR
jgi:hypothetical protein